MSNPTFAEGDIIALNKTTSDGQRVVLQIKSIEDGMASLAGPGKAEVNGAVEPLASLLQPTILERLTFLLMQRNVRDYEIIATHDPRQYRVVFDDPLDEKAKAKVLKAIRSIKETSVSAEGNNPRGLSSVTLLIPETWLSTEASAESDEPKLERGQVLDLHGHKATVEFMVLSTVQVTSNETGVLVDVKREYLEHFIRHGYFEAGTVLCSDNGAAVEYATVLTHIGDVYTAKLLTPGEEQVVTWSGRALADWLFAEPLEESEVEAIPEYDPNIPSEGEKVARLRIEITHLKAERDDAREQLAKARKLAEGLREEIDELKDDDANPVVSYEYRTAQKITDFQLNANEKDGWIPVQFNWLGDGDLYVIYRVPVRQQPQPEMRAERNGIIQSAQPAHVDNGMLIVPPAKPLTEEIIMERMEAVFQSSLATSRARADLMNKPLGVTS